MSVLQQKSATKPCATPHLFSAKKVQPRRGSFALRRNSPLDLLIYRLERGFAQGRAPPAYLSRILAEGARSDIVKCLGSCQGLTLGEKLWRFRVLTHGLLQAKTMELQWSGFVCSRHTTKAFNAIDSTYPRLSMWEGRRVRRARSSVSPLTDVHKSKTLISLSRSPVSSRIKLGQNLFFCNAQECRRPVQLPLLHSHRSEHGGGRQRFQASWLVHA